MSSNRKVFLTSAVVLLFSAGLAFAGRGGMPRGGMGMGGMGPRGMGGMGGGGMGPRGMGTPEMSPRSGVNTGAMGRPGQGSFGAMPPGMSSRYGQGGTGARPYATGTGGMGPRGMGTPEMSPRSGVNTGGMGRPGQGSLSAMPPGMSSRSGAGGAAPGAHPYATGAGAANPFGAYHSGWYHGAWNGNYAHWGGYGWGGYGWGGYGSGYPMGMGSWGYGPMLYNMGYSGYSNPYYGMGMGLGGQGVAAGAQGVATAPAAQGASYDYSQPIDTTAQPPQQAATDSTEKVFDQSRAAFMAGNYDQSLALCDQALKSLPGDPAIHEFRGLVLFALKRYDEAAGTLYAVLSAGPGWDWTTMMSLYPSVDTYTGQLRDLESYIKQHTDSAPARFVLAYHYLAQGHTDAAVDQFRKVVRLQPNDTLSAKLANAFTKQDQNGTPATPPPDAAPSKSFDIGGTWSASPANDVAITLTVQKDGSFVWKVNDKGKSREMGGKSTYGNDLLTLDASQGPPLVGKVTWQDENHFKFQVAGGGELDPGLSFTR